MSQSNLKLHDKCIIIDNKDPCPQKPAKTKCVQGVCTKQSSARGKLAVAEHMDKLMQDSAIPATGLTSKVHEKLITNAEKELKKLPRDVENNIILPKEQCPICFDFIKSFQSVVACERGHAYHADCIRDVFTQGNNEVSRNMQCPVCKGKFINLNREVNAYILDAHLIPNVQMNEGQQEEAEDITIFNAEDYGLVPILVENPTTGVNDVRFENPANGITYNSDGSVLGMPTMLNGESVFTDGFIHRGDYQASGGKKTRKKWSRKYKLSINCKRPKGFSQKQYCKYGRKK
jgi:hypothetical protein